MKSVEFENGTIQVDEAVIAAGLGIALPLTVAEFLPSCEIQPNLLAY